MASASSDISGTPPRPQGRVLRPMIVAKQLDLPEGPSGADVQTALLMPRTQLTRELEKYSRPATAATATGSTAVETPVSRVSRQVCVYYCHHHHHHHHFIRSVAVNNSAIQKENLEAEQDTPGSDELLQLSLIHI